MTPVLNFIIIDSEPGIAAQLAERIKKSGFERCYNAKDTCSVAEVAAIQPDIAVLGPYLDADTSVRCIHKIKIVDPSTEILVSSESVPFLNVDGAPFEGIHPVRYDSGCRDFGKALESATNHRAQYGSRADYPVIIGQSDEIRAIKKKMQIVSSKDITVLITGETGTGKELIARSIHYHSRRSNGPLVKVSCGALPDELLESEVFGFQKGAFTGAHKNKPGRLELAHEGTLFIDEIGDLSLGLQAKFLQVLEDKAFARLGGIYDKIVDARVVAATNVDLQKKVKQGRFRQDFFYRLNVVHIKAPALRERKQDIPLLIHYFLNKYCLELRKDLVDIPAKVAKHFNAYHWPGNVRELENAVRRVVALRDWDFIFREMVPDSLGLESERAAPRETGFLPAWEDARIYALIRQKDFSLKKVSRDYVSEAEKNAIITTLAKAQWNRKRTAHILGVSYKTLLNRIEKFALKP
ncbi:MAG: sigma-54-dependent Fis family transcriptional regulator [Deltaproteobacteria bacterium]|nr:sigma-54-dependent Fis family transcriptional regulator [Deltaproteobacteria bacterium]